MILEYLQPDPTLAEGGTVLLRGLTHAAMLGAAGLGLFRAGFGDRLDAAEQARLDRLLLGAALLGIALTILALPLRVLVLTAGASAFDVEVLRAVMESRNGDAFWIRLAALSTLALSARGGRWRDALAGAGALGVAASYAALGHSTLFRPRQELAGLVTLHLLAVAGWVGSLLPVAWAARRGDAALVAAWSRLALWLVVAILLSGALLVALLVRRADLLLAGWYGYALLAKLALVGVMLALALRHRQALTPALVRGEAGAGRRLSDSILLEAAVALLVFWAAAEMVSVHPLDAGHRIAG